MNVITESVARPKKKVWSLQEETKLLLKIYEKLMRRYGEQKTVLRRSVGKLVKILLHDLLRCKYISTMLPLTAVCNI